MAKRDDARLLAKVGFSPNARRTRLRLYAWAESLKARPFVSISAIISSLGTGLEKFTSLGGYEELVRGLTFLMWGITFLLLLVRWRAGRLLDHRARHLGDAKHVRLLRQAVPGDEALLHETLLRALPGAMPEDISPPEIFRRWLDTGKVLFVVVEAIDARGRFIDSHGFYSIYPLTRTAFDQLCANELYHDDIDDSHLTRMRIAPGGAAPEEPINLFILDVEAVAGTGGRPIAHVAQLLLNDVAQQVSSLMALNYVQHVCTLGASAEGQHWSEEFGMPAQDRDYFPLRHGTPEDPWKVHVALARDVKDRLQALARKGWPDRARPYPRLEDDQDRLAKRRLSGEDGRRERRRSGKRKKRRGKH